MKPDANCPMSLCSRPLEWYTGNRNDEVEMLKFQQISQIT